MFPWDWLFDENNPVNKVTRAVYDFVYRIVSYVVDWFSIGIYAIWTVLYTIGAQVASIFVRFAELVANIAVTIATTVAHVVAEITKWVGGLIANVWGYVTGFFAWITARVVWLEAKIAQVFQDIIKWVYDNFIRPIWDKITDTISWVTGWINRIWMYIEHPELLVELIGGVLMRLWTQYVLRFGSAFARWLVRSMMGMAGEIFDLLERILDSVL